jgi:hypothetical protein
MLVCYLLSMIGAQFHPPFLNIILKKEKVGKFSGYEPGALKGARRVHLVFASCRPEGLPALSPHINPCGVTRLPHIYSTFQVLLYSLKMCCFQSQSWSMIVVNNFGKKEHHTVIAGVVLYKHSGKDDFSSDCWNIHML